MRTEFKDAKDMFFYYGGSKYQMMRDDLIDEYLSYKIPKDVEKKWVEEMFYQDFRNLDINDNNLLLNISQLIFVHSLIDKLDLVYNFVVSNLDKIENKENVSTFIYRILDTLNKTNSADLKDENIRFKKINEYLNQ
ncbi:MAG: hypothetical protein ACK5M3_19100 [Dysgonomonas sp.]